MSNVKDESPEGLAKKYFVITVSALAIYVLAVVLFVL